MSAVVVDGLSVPGVNLGCIVDEQRFVRAERTEHGMRYWERIRGHDMTCIS